MYSHPVDGIHRDVRTLTNGDVLVPTMIDDVAIAVSDILG